MSFEYQRHEERGIETGGCMSMRAEFEKWYSQEGEYSGLPLDCFDEDGDYVDDFVQSMWMAWQAASAQGGQGAEPIGFVAIGRSKIANRKTYGETADEASEKMEQSGFYTYHVEELYTQPQPAVPEGWKLVPIEPTHEMTEQGAQEADWYAHNAYDCYKAMLDAAPQPPKEDK